MAANISLWKFPDKRNEKHFENRQKTFIPNKSHKSSPPAILAAPGEAELGGDGGGVRHRVCRREVDLEDGSEVGLPPPHPVAGDERPRYEVGLQGEKVHHKTGAVLSIRPEHREEGGVGPHRHHYHCRGPAVRQVSHSLDQQLGRRETPQLCSRLQTKENKYQNTEKVVNNSSTSDERSSSQLTPEHHSDCRKPRPWSLWHWRSSPHQNLQTSQTQLQTQVRINNKTNTLKLTCHAFKVQADVVAVEISTPPISPLNEPVLPGPPD